MGSCRTRTICRVVPTQNRDEYIESRAKYRFDISNSRTIHDYLRVAPGFLTIAGKLPPRYCTDQYNYSAAVRFIVCSQTTKLSLFDKLALKPDSVQQQHVEIHRATTGMPDIKIRGTGRQSSLDTELCCSFPDPVPKQKRHSNPMKFRRSRFWDRHQPRNVKS